MRPMSSPDPTARLADLREELEARIGASGDEQPSWWPALDLSIRELSGGTDYDLAAHALGIDHLASRMGPRYYEVRERLKGAATELLERVG